MHASVDTRHPPDTAWHLLDVLICLSPSSSGAPCAGNATANVRRLDRAQGGVRWNARRQADNYAQCVEVCDSRSATQRPERKEEGEEKEEGGGQQGRTRCQLIVICDH